ncbi:MAG: TetR-family transcriptional regulator [Alphaproteobacteria bacterium]|jgi:AcrR family transcriptional regulator|nr:TetR-family transcriptional regulator [Alphaproteobacteria bacterium]
MARQKPSARVAKPAAAAKRGAKAKAGPQAKAGPVGKRTRTPNRVRRAVSREAVLKSARSLFVAQGYLATSVDDIARKAGYSKGGVYFYFLDKSQILHELLVQSCALYAEIIATLKNEKLDPIDRLVSWVNNVSRLGAEAGDEILLPILISLEFLGVGDDIEHLVKAHHQAQLDALVAALRDGRKAGIIRDSGPIREQAASLSALANGALLEWFRRKDELNGRAFVRALREIVIVATCVDERRGGNAGR